MKIINDNENSTIEKDDSYALTNTLKESDGHNDIVYKNFKADTASL